MLRARISMAHTCGTTGMHSRRMLKKAFQQGRRRVETGGYPLGYVEDFDEPRTKLANFFSILLVTAHPPIVSTTRNRALPLIIRS